MIRIGLSSILTAFQARPIGSKVTESSPFLYGLGKAIEAHDFDADRVPGQGFLVVPELIPFVSAGDGLRTTNADDFHPMEHRGNVELFLRREHAGEVNFCACVVYTLEAYVGDPEVDAAEAAALRKDDITHVLVAVIASSGPEAPLTPHRLVSNLAGGNKEALEWTKEEIHDKAKATKEYWDKYCVVAG